LGFELGWAQESIIRWGAHRRHLANTIEWSMCGSDAACCQLTLTTWSILSPYHIFGKGEADTSDLLQRLIVVSTGMCVIDYSKWGMFRVM